MRLPTRPSTRSPLASQPEADRSFLFGGGGQARPLSCPEIPEETGFPMLTKIMKWVSIAALLGALLWPSASYRILLEFVVCASAILVLLQAWGRGKYLWGTGFIAIAGLFNPIAPAVLPRQMLVWLDLVCLAMFVLSLAALRTGPRLSMPPIINRTPRSESVPQWTDA